MVKIALDAGHGMNTAGKRTPDGEREWSFNNKVILAAIAKLNTYKDVEILRLDDPAGKVDVPLNTRTNRANAWGADVLASIHHNAHSGEWGSWGGVETYTQPGSQQASVDIAKVLQARIVGAMGLRDRGIKKANLHMTRMSKMPAVLTEGGFMDSTTDIGVMRSDAKLKAQGVAIADGLASYFGLSTTKVQAPVAKPKPVTPKPKPKPSKPTTSKDTNSIVDYLNSLEINSSPANRKKLAIEYGIKGYDLSAAKNTELLNAMRKGKPVVKPEPKAKTSIGKNLGLVDWMKVNKMDSSYKNRENLYGSGYKGTESQNIKLLNKLQNKPVSKPTATPKTVAKKNTVHLPKTAKTWRTYKLNVQPVKANSDWSLTPSAFGGITYEVLGKPYKDVVTVNTGRGKRNIFIGSGTGAVIK